MAVGVKSRLIDAHPTTLVDHPGVTRMSFGARTIGAQCRDQHLADCDGCTNYLQLFRSTIATLGRITEGQLDSGFRARLLDAFRTRR